MIKSKNIIKKAISMTCVSAMLVAGIPSGKAFAAEAAPDTAAVQESVKLAPAAEDCMQKIYDSLTKEGSQFSKNKKEMEELLGDTLTYSAAISGNAITITAVGKDAYAESSGSWDYILEGDYLTYKPKEGDYQGDAYFTFLIDAVADYLGMDSDLVNGYIIGINVKNLSSEYYSVEKDAEGNVTKLKLYVGGTYDMKELDGFYLDADSLDIFGTLDESSISGIAHIGKVMLYVSGKKNSVEFFIGEHDALTNLAYQSILETVKTMQPVGYEEFLENYKELSEVSTDTYQVSYVTDTAELPEALQDESHYKFIRLHFSVPALSSSSLSMEAGGFDFLMPEECEVKKWSSSNKKVATVEDGQVTALKKGKATITATLTDGTKLACKVTVTSNPTLKIGGKAYKKNAVYTVKKNGILKAAIKGKAVFVDNAYKSSKKAVAKIKSGKMEDTVKIKGIKKGTSKITIKVNGVSFTFQVKVK